MWFKGTTCSYSVSLSLQSSLKWSRVTMQHGRKCISQYMLSQTPICPLIKIWIQNYRQSIMEQLVFTLWASLHDVRLHSPGLVALKHTNTTSPPSSYSLSQQATRPPVPIMLPRWYLSLLLLPLFLILLPSSPLTLISSFSFISPPFTTAGASIADRSLP